MPSLDSRISLRHSENDLIDALFYERFLNEARFLETAYWPCVATRYEGPGDLLARRRWTAGETVLVELEEAVAYLALGGGEANVRVAAASGEIANMTLVLLREHLPEMRFEGETRPIAFWSDHPMGPRRVTRAISVPTWAEIAANYPLDIAQEVERTVAFRPTSAGQLLLWRGEPGTGKTWAIRALIREWSSWARFHYVTDPDCLFGHNASYMLSVLLDDESGPSEASDGSDVAELWKVLVLEDAGEMLSRDARERSGQGLSRLLNLVDGLIGQGLRVLCLVTTNEELGSLHPAISRPGRCAVNSEFRALSREEAQAWLDERGADMRVTMPHSIADLYAILSGNPIPAPEVVGFAFPAVRKGPSGE